MLLAITQVCAQSLPDFRLPLGIRLGLRCSGLLTLLPTLQLRRARSFKSQFFNILAHRLTVIENYIQRNVFYCSFLSATPNASHTEIC